MNAAAFGSPMGRYIRAGDEGDGFVYFIAAEEIPRIKIGWSRTLANAVDRAAHLQIGSPVRLYLAGLMPGSQDIERRLHKRFAAIRVRGEWFESTEELHAFILSLPPVKR